MNRNFARRLGEYFTGYCTADADKTSWLDEVPIRPDDFIIGYLQSKADPTDAIVFGDSFLYFRERKLWTVICYQTISSVRSDQAKIGPPFWLEIEETTGAVHRLRSEYAYGVHSALIHPGIKKKRLL